MVILTYPHDSLRKKAVAVEKVTLELVDIANEMYKLMKEANGIGLAAPQVGLDIRLIVIEDSGQPCIMFNPVILKRSTDVEYKGEGCLSFPGVSRLIKRPKEVIVKYRDERGKMQHAVFNGLQARCVCHEIEHLDGKLLIDHEEKNKA